MMHTDEIRLGDALHSVPSPPGLGVPTDDVLAQGKRTRRRKTAVTTSMTTLSVASVAAAALWGGQLLLHDSGAPTVVPAGDVTDVEEHTYPGVHVEDIYDMTHAEQMASLAESMGLEDPPEVDIIREISPAEANVLIPECLAEKGWTAEDRVYSIPTDQEQAFSLDRYSCVAAYPVIQERTTTE
ncbi:hypothetical protein [Ornithinimicrobium sp. Y1694]|uniref:hypothetical protein n=1 Tax=Ornithinimicrobium sp. Y1694 TaxID=3418590 RepID=UPI003CE94DF8